MAAEIGLLKEVCCSNVLNFGMFSQQRLEIFKHNTFKLNRKKKHVIVNFDSNSCVYYTFINGRILFLIVVFRQVL